MSKIIMFSSTGRLVLASGSSYRKILLERLGVPFTVCSADIDETPHPGEAPAAVAERLAIDKARAVAFRFPDHLIIGADQVATLDDVTVLGKPLTHANAVDQLMRLSGKQARFYTAVSLLNSRSAVVRSSTVATTVEFRHLSPTGVETYLQRDQPYDCTGSAKIESRGIVLVRRVVSDDPSALIGLPLIALQDLLAAEGIDLI